MYSRRGDDSSRNGGSGSNSGSDDPPMSRLFIICNKSNTEDDFRDTFDKFGKIEEIYAVKDRNSGENKGIVYIKYSKTSEAAQALEEMNGKSLGIPSGARPLKVLVASSRNQGSGRSDNEQEKYVRLFVIIPKGMNEDELRSEFGKYGEIDNVTLIKDKVTRECKGFAYIKYFKFSHAAVAFENCGNKYRAVFAEPKNSSRSSNNSNSERRCDDNNLSSFSSNTSRHSSGGGGGGSGNNSNSTSRSLSNEYASFLSSTMSTSFPANGSGNNSGGNNDVQLSIICSSSVNQDQLWRLFDIVPGLDYCQITGDCGHNSNYATATYNNIERAQYAREKIHGLEYPPGQRIIIKPINESKPNSDSMFSFDGNGSSKDNFCSVSLPAPAPMANPTSTCAQRCFVVCVPKALPGKILSNVFSRFGDLIDVYMLPNKNCGYAKYASESSAMKAIEVLHSAEICGIKLKVMEAEEPRDAKRKRYDD